MIKRYLTILSILLIGDLLNAQVPSFIWVKQGAVVGNPYSQATGRRVVTDAAGNSYVTGDFDGPSLTLGGITLTSPVPNNGTLYVVKYDPAGNVLWAKQTDSCRSMGTGVALDGAGKLYLVGQYYFANPYTATGSFGATKFAVGNGGMFVAQLDAATGNINWMKQGLGVGGSNTSQGVAIATYGTSSIYVAGTFNGTVTWGGITRTSASYYDAFLAKYDYNGNVLWLQTARGQDQTAFNTVTTDKKGNIYTGGSYKQNLRIGTDTFTRSYSMMVAKYDSMGQFQWSRSSGGSTTTNNFSKMTSDSKNNIYLIGMFAVNNGTLSFGANSITNTTGTYQSFVVKYDEAGNSIWLKKPGGGFNAAVYNPGITTDRNDNIYMTGSYQGTATFGSTTLTAILNGNTEDIYVAKLDTGGNAIWAKSAGSNYADQSGDIAVDNFDNVFITGNNRAGGTGISAAFDTITVTIPGDQKFAFTAKIGTVSLVPPINAAFVQGDTVICAGKTVSFVDQSEGSPTGWSWTFPGGNPSTSIEQNPTVTYNSPGTYPVVLVASNSADNDSVVKTGLIKVNTLPSPTLTVADTAICSGDSTLVCAPTGYTTYQWNVGGVSTNCAWVKQAGNVRTTVTDANGCSASTPNQAITVYPVLPVSVTIKGDTLTAVGVDSCQWFLNDTAIPGATQPVYIAKRSGNYSLEVYNGNGCRTRSSNIPLVINGIEETTVKPLSVYPNPFSNTITISAESMKGMELYDITGRMILAETYPVSSNKITINLSYLPQGMYYLKIKANDRLYYEPVIKQ